jgi:hypothetical protein
MKFVKSNLLILSLVIIYLFDSAFTKRHKTQSKRTKKFISKKNKNTCEVGFGFDGLTSGDAKKKIEKKSLISLIPKEISFNWKTIIDPIIKLIVGKIPFDAAIGDFPSSKLSDKTSGLDNYLCDSVPLESSSKMGIIGLSVNKVPCGVPTDLKLCAAFDRCGTFVLSVSGGSLKCLLYATGIGSVVAEGGNFLRVASFGVSPNKKFSNNVKLGIFDGKEMKYSEFKINGHFFISLGTGIPSILNIKEIPLKEFFVLEGNAKTIVDFGTFNDAAKQIVLDVNNNKKADIINRIMFTGLNLSILADGKVGINLEKITLGLFPNLEISAKNLNAVITTKNALNGVSEGIYIRLDGDSASNIAANQKKIFQHFAAILSFLGMKDIKQETDLVGSISINNSFAAFEFTTKSLQIKCALKFENYMASCQFGNIFFNTELKSLKWFVTKTKEFFGQAEKDLMTIASGVGQFVQDSIKVSKALGVDKNLFDWLSMLDIVISIFHW